MRKDRIRHIAARSGMAAVLMGTGAVAAMAFHGVVRDGKLMRWSTQAACTDGCPGGFYSAHYEVLRCSYAGLWGARYMKFLVSGWQGDTEINSAYTAKPFPPPLPAYRRLTESEVAKVRAGRAKSEVCPPVYDPHYGTDEANEFSGAIPVVDG